MNFPSQLASQRGVVAPLESPKSYISSRNFISDTSHSSYGHQINFGTDFHSKDRNFARKRGRKINASRDEPPICRTDRATSPRHSRHERLTDEYFIDRPQFTDHLLRRYDIIISASRAHFSTVMFPLPLHRASVFVFFRAQIRRFFSPDKF